MPLLPLEPFVFPEDLFQAPARAPEGAELWWVLHTRPRAEKSLVRRLLGRHHPFFLPLYQRRWRSRGRLLSAYLPLFPGYVFLMGDHQARLETLQTNLVVRCLTVEDQPRLHADLERVYRLMASGAPLTSEERLRPGTLVEITDGPLAGLQGKVVRQGKREKFTVEVDFLQRGASVELEGWMIKPLESGAAAPGSG